MLVSSFSKNISQFGTTRITRDNQCVGKLGPHWFEFTPLSLLYQALYTRFLEPSNLERSMSQLELNCLILGQDPNSSFTIEIADTKTVSALKEAIRDKKQPDLDYRLDGSNLHIFKVSFNMDADINATLQNFRPEHNPTIGVHHLSLGVKRLKSVFGKLVDEHIHIVVQLPPRPPPGEHQSLWLPPITHRGIFSYLSTFVF
jgi:hypothetical protein